MAEDALRLARKFASEASGYGSGDGGSMPYEDVNELSLLAIANALVAIAERLDRISKDGIPR